MNDRQPTWSWVADGFLAVIFISIVQLEIWVFGEGDFAFSTQLFASILSPIAIAPLALRTRAPIPAFVVNTVGVLALVGVGFSSSFYPWTNLILLFSLAARVSPVASWLGLAASLFGVFFYFASFDRAAGPLVAAFTASLWLVAWLAGRVAGARIMQTTMRADRDLARALAEARKERIELEAERSALARELHDLVGHTVNVMVVHAGAGRRALGTDPAAAEQALTTIETTGRSALEDLDRVLGVLRTDDPDAPTAPLPGLATLPDLADQFGRAGLSTRIDVVGPVGDVPASVGLSTYRIVQEALTNTLKHASAGSALATILVDADAVHVEIEDDGASDGDISPGRGLTGITERAELHGGTAAFERSDRGGVRVRCRLPLPRPA